VPYSLVSAATLGFDLVRLPAGRDVAEVLLTGLDAGVAGLHRLAAAHPGEGRTREQRGVLAVRSRRARELAASVPHVRGATAGLGAVGTDRVETDRAALLVDQLERGTIGDAPTLERLLREDVLGPEHATVARVDGEVAAAAADVLADAAVGHWAAEVLPPLVRRELVAPFTRAELPQRATPDLGPATAGLLDLLAHLRGLDDAGRARWRAAVDEGRGEHRSWAGAMHEAAWAAHVSGRTRTLATAQLMAVQAFRDGGFSGRDGARGMWNAVSGGVQGLAMADLLDDRSVALLQLPWTRATR
jgi:hypothetical protein